MFNLGVLSPDDFYAVTECDEGGIDFIDRSTEEIPVLLTEDGLKKVISAFEKKMETLVYYPPLETQLSWQMIIIEQIKHFKRVIYYEALPLVNLL